MPGLIAMAGQRLGFNPAAWLRDTSRMRGLVRRFQTRAAEAPDEAHFAVVLMPWLATAVPWFSLAVGLLLAARGARVSFVVDDMPFGEHPLRFRFISRCIRSVCRVLRHRFPVFNLSDYRAGGPLTPEVIASIERLASLNAVWALRGEAVQGGRTHLIARTARQLTASVPAITRLVSHLQPDAILIPGGIYGSSGVWVEQSRRAGIRVSSYDSGGPGIMMLAADGIACQLQDIPRAMRILRERSISAAERDEIRECVRAEMARRRAGTDRFSSQIQGSPCLDQRFEGAVLLALNSSWDSAALGLHAVFADSMEWLIETTSYLLEHLASPVIVRQHPAERMASSRTSDDYGAVLRQRFGSHPRLHFIAADDPVNSYDLLEHVGAVVVHSSTFGVEAALRSKVVVTASRSYYSDLGFVWNATTLDGYHAHLRNAATGAYRVTDAMQDDALSCYYLTQCCNWIASPFSPESFPSWSREELAELSRHEPVGMTVSSLAQNVPVALLNHDARNRRGESP